MRTLAGESKGGLLAHVTPVILCYNEEENIERTLTQLRWAQSVVIVDSFSTDQTPTIASRFLNVVIYKRIFDTHARQWNYGLRKARTDWILSLDADYVISDELIEDISEIFYPSQFAAYRACFRMCVCGRPLRCGVMPPRLILFNKNYCHYYDDGHTQRLNVDGPISDLRGHVFHDDRKPLDRFLWSQSRYSILEADRIESLAQKYGGIKDFLRARTILWPFLLFFYVILWKKGFLDGSHGLYYAFQRLVWECTIILRLLDKKVCREKNKNG